ncbi:MULTISPECIES: TRAP transporter substrate-binding protein DctP [unclassified Vibrio]|uniref:TRAP transporter substrate-binding protein DctP n=1 Tax=Vibrio sp. HB236076 TaxID=3232307 RepID=A0AB39HHG2_9VIBR|nr:TRAP transporter substrate-binding protein DctP [Vibrio sp. HB161653]MDP5254469.1 TRAP transporter substrate-binding protein DctP [Vibrio sp. HB161653]
MKTSIFLLIAACVTASLSLQAKTLVLSHAMSLDSAAHQGMVIFADKVQQKSYGELTVEIKANSEFGYGRKLAEHVINGNLDIAKINGSLAEAFEPNYTALSLPFLFRNTAHMRSFIRSEVAQEILHSSSGKGFIGLTFYDSGSRSFYSTEPITSPDDLHGKKIRVPESPTMLQMVEAFNAEPVLMPLPKVYDSLEQGLIDVAENDISTLVEMQHADLTKFYSTNQHTMSPDVLIISESTWNKLSKVEQRILKQAASDSLDEEIKIWNRLEIKNIANARNQGVTFIRSDKQAFRNKVKPLFDEAMKDENIAYYVEKINNL